MSNELSLAELDNELCEALPTRTLMSHRRMHRVFFVRNSCSCSCNRGFNTFSFHHRHRFNTFGFNGGFNGGFGGVSNFNSTRQSIFNPQTAIGFGGGGISQFGGNSNFNNSTQFGFSGF